ncbi:hypothetical protein B9M40_001199 [Salmonella enterica subsp. enterica serovar Praha]|nr:hypothetical protein [Salmonella enterica]ECV4978195.1 hypothetical protein [Salmonella enterica subsp. enterica serovar Praha]ECW2988257.1 hypothetical protein [Salmonella enterica subsp. enterica serovar Praha]EDF7609798.1 hypothetical protein [Salmonella enterica]EEF4622826.1 hypothetical protein [Salmonella enterica]
MMKKVLTALAVMVVVGSVIPQKAYAISASYRAKLERSGCTQVTESQGCNVNKSKEWNKQHGFHEEMKEGQSEHIPTANSWEVNHAKASAFVEDNVLGEMGRDARQALLNDGWVKTSSNDTWVKNGIVLSLQANSKGKVVSGKLQ